MRKKLGSLIFRYLNLIVSHRKTALLVCCALSIVWAGAVYLLVIKAKSGSCSFCSRSTRHIRPPTFQ